MIHFDDKHANPNLSIHVLGRRYETVRIRRYVHHWGKRNIFMNETNNVGWVRLLLEKENDIYYYRTLFHVFLYICIEIRLKEKSWTTEKHFSFLFFSFFSQTTKVFIDDGRYSLRMMHVKVVGAVD